jgi:NTP pyrophosphatase (non-canonical NTP hydrolase)
MITGKLRNMAAIVATRFNPRSKPMQDDLAADLRTHLASHLEWAPTGEDRLPFLVLALCGEANLIKKGLRGDGGDRRAETISELADVGNYALMLAMHLDIDLRAAMLAKLIEVEQRPAWKARHQKKGEEVLNEDDKVVRGQ